MSILQLVQISAPWGRPLRNHSPSQEGGEALGGQACITLWSKWITAQAATRFQLLLHCSPNGCTVLMFWSAAVFADPAHHAHIAFHTCEPDLGWQAESMWGLKHGSGVTGVIYAHTALYWSCSCQSVLKLKPCLLLSVRVTWPQSFLSPSTVFKLADSWNLLPSLYPISDGREWDNVLERSKHPNYCLPPVICVEGSCTFSWICLLCSGSLPLCIVFPPT